MAKTAASVSSRRAKLEVVLTSAIGTALSTISTAETVDISSVIRTFTSPALNRVVNETYVIGDDDPILDYDTRKQRNEITSTALYTEGDTLGTDNFDLHEFLMELIEYTTSDLPLQIIYSPKGGANGDYEYTSDASETFLTTVGEIVSNPDTAERLSFNWGARTSGWVKSVVS